MTLDPRISEIEFLESLDRRTGGAEYTILYESVDSYHGLPPDRFRDLVCDLLLEGCLNGPASMPWGKDYAFHEVGFSARQAFDDVFKRQAIRLQINHKGRLRLWRLKDELFSRRLRDKFGILLDQRHWEQDLYLHMLDVDVEKPLTLIQCDLDHFKSVNDKLGHDAGDMAIKSYFRVADDILGTSGDAYCRGGDEVLAILPSTTLERGTALADEVRQLVSEEFADDVSFKNAGISAPTVSVGVAVFHQRLAPKEASEFVDQLQRKAKVNGRNRVESAEFTQS